MTTINEARAAAYQRWLDEWKADNNIDPLTPFTFDNESFDPPEDDQGKPLPWVRLSVRNLASGSETLGSPGNRKHTRRAIVRAEIYTPPGGGQLMADELGQKVLDLYEGRQLAGALTYDGQYNEVGLVEEDRWNLSTAQVSFDYEAIR